MTVHKLTIVYDEESGQFTANVNTTKSTYPMFHMMIEDFLEGVKKDWLEGRVINSKRVVT